MSKCELRKQLSRDQKLFIFRGCYYALNVLVVHCLWPNKHRENLNAEKLDSEILREATK
ncbi:hypothetical protein DOT_6124 [Desulfosporosinus sp. OT]|nr:hypothetical protein DOT_6124 [Desulfosporosinus sp. OT]